MQELITDHQGLLKLFAPDGCDDSSGSPELEFVAAVLFCNVLESGSSDGTGSVKSLFSMGGPA